ncbi:MAG: SBBP repeat-containing protein [Ardenticatenales bacterium]|nr:SBBP repeat-containing protein [Ardenticatenales bacterium]
MLKHWNARIIMALAALGLVAVANGSVVHGKPAEMPSQEVTGGRLGFIPNGGQWDEAVQFHTESGGVDVWLQRDGYTYAVANDHTGEAPILTGNEPDVVDPQGVYSADVHAVRVTFEGASEATALLPTGQQAGKHNWLVGPEEDWVTDLNAYGGVSYRDVWPGIEASVRTGGGPMAVGQQAPGGQSVVKWSYHLAPNADPSQIQLRFEGADSVAIENGLLKIGTQLGDFTETGLIAFQDVAGERRAVSAEFTLVGDTVGFAVGAYNPALPLVIDPVVLFSRRFGGSSTDLSSGISRDGAGNLYTSGWTASTNYPTQSGFQNAANVTYDCFVTKTNADNSALTYSTYIGSNSTDADCRSVLNPNNEVILSAITFSTLWVGAPFLIGTPGGTPDVGMVILNAAGNGLVASARVGATSSDYAHGLARMPNGNIVVTGQTFSTTGWPALGGFRPALIGSPDGFAIVLNSGISAATAFSYFGGNSSDYGGGVAVDASNNIYAMYGTLSTDPTLIGGGGGNYDVGVAKFNSTLTAQTYNSRFGGNSTEPFSPCDTCAPGTLYQTDNSLIAVDAAGRVYVTGATASTDYPTTAGSFQPAASAVYDGFVTIVNAAGNGLAASSYLGGNSTDTGKAIGIDGGGRVYVAGHTAATNFPTTPGEVQGTNAGNYDYFRTIFLPDLSDIVCSTYWGGNSTDHVADMEIVGNYKTILSGTTASANFPQIPSGSTVFGGGGGYDIGNAYLNCGGANLVITNSALTNRGSVRTSVSPIAFPDGNGAEPMAVQPPAAEADAAAPVAADGAVLPYAVQQLPENEECLAPGNFVQITIEITNTGLSDQLGAGPEYVASWDGGLLAGQPGSCAFFVGAGNCQVSASSVSVDADIPSGGVIQFAWMVRIAGGLAAGTVIPVNQTLFYDTDDDGINESFPQDALGFTLNCFPTVWPNNQLGKQVHLPILNFQGQDDVCESWIEVQNIGCRIAKAALVTWGEPGFCPPQAAGPLKVECTGLLKPGSTWNLYGAQVPTGSKSGILFKLSARQLSEDGIDVIPEDDITGDYVCEVLFFNVVGDADDYRRFKKAYNEGLVFDGIDMVRASGDGLLAVDVHRSCPGDATPGVDVTSKYNGLAGTHLGTYDEVYGGYSYYVPLVYASAAGFNTIIYIQNGGLMCSSLEIWFKARDDCLRATICDIATLAPGETYQLDANDCVGPDFQGSAWIRSTQVMGIAVDIIGGDVLMTYVGEPGEINYTFDPNKSTTRDGNQVAFAPLTYSEYQGWDAGIQVQNLSAVFAAKVKIYFLDRGGDIITTLVDWVCPRGSQTFFLPVVFDLPGNWVGSARAESQEWISPGSPNVLAPNIVGIVTLIKYTDVARTSKSEAIAYNMLPEHKIYDWQLGFGGGGLDSGIGLIAIPSLLKDLENSGLTSEIAIANVVPKPGFTDLVIYFYDQNGLLDYVCQKLNEKQVEYIDLQTWGYISDGFKGSAIISAWFWEHDVFDDTGFFLRNLVGLGAVSVERKGDALGRGRTGRRVGG